MAAELGCDRDAEGAREHLEDVVTSLSGRGWHWAFYSFREDAWDPLWRVLQEALGAER